MRRRKILSLFCSLMVIIAFSIPVFAEGKNGTTLKDASVTASANWERVFDWQIEKSVTPDEWNLFQGDTATSQYTVHVDKDNGTDTKTISGVVSIKNAGAVATENLYINVHLTNPNGSVVLASTDVDLSANPVLDPDENGDYNYTIPCPDSIVSEDTYKVTADITITNHSGHLNKIFGLSPSSEGFQVPTTPTKVTNDTINVDDTNGSSWEFSKSGNVTYDKTFTATDKGIHPNTATIRETGASSTANVAVNLFALDVSNTATTSLTRTYDWNINKIGDQKELLLTKNQEFPINYQVQVDAKHDDSNWEATGTISIHNPAPISAVINSVSDIVSNDIAATVTGAEFPYTIPAGGTLELRYTVDLHDAADRTSTATATLQNHTYNTDKTSDDSGTTDFSGTATLNFDDATVHLIDETVEIDDNLYGHLGTVSYDDTLPKIFEYTKNVGPYTNSGDYTVDNTAVFTTNDTGTTGDSTWTVNIHLPSQGSTLTIGYWKTHAGFGPQKDMVTKHLPLWLGTPNGGKSILIDSSPDAVKHLSMLGDASNGINKLYAQMLAAKLNIANGADETVIKDVLTKADAFLAGHNNSYWSGISKSDKKLVLDWATTLDHYNNGLMGVPHASE